MRLPLSLTCALGACAVLSACSGARSAPTAPSRVEHVTQFAQPPAVAHRAASWPCRAPSVAEESSELVPGTPCAIVLSRYARLPARPGTLLVGRVRVSRRSLLQRLTNELNALPLPQPGVYSCPDDDGSEIVAVLQYTHKRDPRLTITLTGCSVARRESVNRSTLGRTGTRLRGELERLVAHR